MSYFGVTTLKCNPAKSGFPNTTSFHVCIDKKCLPQFINPENWPEHVVVREWFFKAKDKNPAASVGLSTAGAEAASVDVPPSSHDVSGSNVLLPSSESSDSINLMDHGATTE
jgi:hypothetical protein